MSEHFQAIVFRGDGITPDVQLSRRIRSYLTGAGIIAAEPSDCTLGDPAKSFAPGVSFQHAVSENDDLLSTLRTNGVEFREGRVVEMPPDIFEATCPSCKHRSELGDQF